MTTAGHLKGMMMVIIGAAFWGISGTVAQTLFQDHHITVDWLVDIRLLVSGLILLFVSLIGKERKKVFSIWKNPRMGVSLFIFGFFGMLGVQYTYLAAVAVGNAAIATLLQYLAPVFIVGYFTFKNKKLPHLLEWVAIFLALVGTFLLLTNGSTKNLHIPLLAVIWGLLSGVALAFYTIYPGKMLAKWGAPIVIGWSMLIGGIGLMFRSAPWQLPKTHWTMETLAFISFVVFFGTLIAFYLYLESQRYISAKESSLLACTEPLTAVFTTILWLHVPMGVSQIVGALAILGMIVLLAIKPEPQKLESLTVIDSNTTKM